MISTSWGAPAAFTKGFNLQHVSDGLYGRHLHVYSWPGGELKQTLDLGNTGLLPLEVLCLFICIVRNYMLWIIIKHTCLIYLQIRFLHDPAKDTGFVGCALTSNMVRFFKKPDESWGHEVCQNWLTLSDQQLKVTYI